MLFYQGQGHFNVIQSHFKLSAKKRKIIISTVFLGDFLFVDSVDYCRINRHFQDAHCLVFLLLFRHRSRDRIKFSKNTRQIPSLHDA